MPKIKNYKSLASTKPRQAALQIAEAGLAAIDTERVIGKQVKLAGSVLLLGSERFALSDVGRIFVVGVGKCALGGGRALERILGEKITAGIIVDLVPGKLKRLKSLTGTHPWPTERNVDVTKEIIKLLAETRKQDLVIFLISGGGSTLLCQPGNFTCMQESNIVRCLTRAGAKIGEINLVRKHLSYARGGFLAKYAYPSRVVAMIFSDVPGDEIEFIASGPTVKDTTTASQAKEILLRYDTDKCCDIALNELIETPKEDKYFARVKNFVLVNNYMALLAMQAKARSLGFQVKIVSRTLQGVASSLGPAIAKKLHRARRKTVLLYGGETTVVLRGEGKGGRNQELALSALPALAKDEIVLAIASDGRDNTDSAGGICDIITQDRAAKLGLSPVQYLHSNDSYNFFRKVGQAIRTGYTGSNVSDLIVAGKI